jgi:hypothetical protein
VPSSRRQLHEDRRVRRPDHRQEVEQRAEALKTLPGRRAYGKTRGFVVDQHQVNSIIAAAICDCCKGHPEGGIDPEEAKQIPK